MATEGGDPFGDVLRRKKLSLEGLAKLANLSHTTVRKARRGGRLRNREAGRLEEACGWESGSLDRVRRGLPPIWQDAGPTGSGEGRLPVESHAPPLSGLDDAPDGLLRDDAERRFWSTLVGASLDGKMLLLQVYRGERQRGEEGSSRAAGT